MFLDGLSNPWRCSSIFFDQLHLPLNSPLPGSELTKEPFRWDQRLFALVLRLPGAAAAEPEQLGSVPTDESAITQMCEVTGGNWMLLIGSHLKYFFSFWFSFTSCFFLHLNWCVCECVWCFLCLVSSSTGKLQNKTTFLFQILKVWEHFLNTPVRWIGKCLRLSFQRLALLS